MVFQQATLAGLLVLALVLFAWGRWRHDVVAVTILLIAVGVGIVPPESAFRGFGHPAVITVASVLLLSFALESTGLVGALARRLIPAQATPMVQVLVFGGLGAVLSAFINNVGALALLMPMIIAASTKAAGTAHRVLMPLSFATMLGGLTTLIGTPPNIIVASIREQKLGAGYGLFDFMPVGGITMLCGLAFLVLVGWRLIPHRTAPTDQPLKGVEEYVAEFQVEPETQALDLSLGEIVETTEKHDVDLLGVIRDEQWIPSYAQWQRLRAGDSIMVEGAPESLAKFDGTLGLTLAGKKSEDDDQPVRPGFADTLLAEVVLTPQSPLVGSTAEELRMRSRYLVNLLAVYRQGARHFGTLKKFRFAPGDVLLLQGVSSQISAAITQFQGLSLAERGLQVHERRAGLIAGGTFAAVLAAITLSLAPPAVAMAAGVVFLVVAGVLPVRQMYNRVDWPVIVLLAALIPVGESLGTTGLTERIAGLLVDVTSGQPAMLSLLLVMIITMSLSDLINNAATAVVMAPIALVVADRLGAGPDPFLMAVAIGASCAFLTPIGHQNNLLVMGPGGYRFGDYWRVGLPLEILVLAVSVPMLALYWGL